MPNKEAEKSHTGGLAEHLKTFLKKEANSPKKNRWQKIIKLRGEIKT